jgi:hypothetical protein
MKHISTLYILAVGLFALLFSACVEDGITTSPSDQPTLSADTLSLGLVFTGEGTPTHFFKIHNRHDKGIIVSSLRVRDDAYRDVFRFNVDGMAGSDFSDVEIRANDSIFVLVEATFPENGAQLPVEVNVPVDIVVNGVTSTIVLNATTRDVTRLHEPRITADTRWEGTKPIQIFDSLVVENGARLTIGAGVQLCFHAGAYMRVYGSLVTEGTPDAPVDFAGDRFDQVVGSIPYDIMSAQWGGVEFMPGSAGSVMSHTIVRNTSWGVVVDGGEEHKADAQSPELTLLNCRLRNSAANVLSVTYAAVKAVGCELAEAAVNVVEAYLGSNVTINHCTLANYYLFSAVSGALINVSAEDAVGDVSNSILYGNGSIVYPGDLFGYDFYLRASLLKPNGSDDDNFIGILWNTDPLFYTVRSDYYFDYRLHDDSPAIGAANASLTLPEATYDFYGNARGTSPDLGAYVYQTEAE